MAAEWLVASLPAFFWVLVSYIVLYSVIILLTRIAGLRSFSKMSAPDFAMTVAVGSLFGSSISSGTPPLSIAIFAFVCLFSGQWIIAFARRLDLRVGKYVDNDPVLLMDGPDFLESNMKKTNVTKADIRAKLREANVTSLDEVLAVVFETTGDITVLHSDKPGKILEKSLLVGVIRGEE